MNLDAHIKKIIIIIGFLIMVIIAVLLRLSTDLYIFGRYLSELLEERHKLTPFFPVIPHARRLLNQGEHCCFSCLLHVGFSKLNMSFISS